MPLPPTILSLDAIVVVNWAIYAETVIGVDLMLQTETMALQSRTTMSSKFQTQLLTMQGSCLPISGLLPMLAKAFRLMADTLLEKCRIHVPIAEPRLGLPNVPATQAL